MHSTATSTARSRLHCRPRASMPAPPAPRPADNHRRRQTPCFAQPVADDVPTTGARSPARRWRTRQGLLVQGSIDQGLLPGRSTTASVRDWSTRCRSTRDPHRRRRRPSLALRRRPDRCGRQRFVVCDGWSASKTAPHRGDHQIEAQFMQCSCWRTAKQKRSPICSTSSTSATTSASARHVVFRKLHLEHTNRMPSGLLAVIVLHRRVKRVIRTPADAGAGSCSMAPGTTGGKIPVMGLISAVDLHATHFERIELLDTVDHQIRLRWCSSTVISWLSTADTTSPRLEPYIQWLGIARMQLRR